MTDERWAAIVADAIETVQTAPTERLDQTQSRLNAALHRPWEHGGITHLAWEAPQQVVTGLQALGRDNRMLGRLSIACGAILAGWQYVGDHNTIAVGALCACIVGGVIWYLFSN